MGIRNGTGLENKEAKTPLGHNKKTGAGDENRHLRPTPSIQSIRQGHRTEPMEADASCWAKAQKEEPLQL